MTKSLVLAAAAASLCTVAGAQAADLPAAPEPVDYVRVCDAYGAGYFYIPGTETCLRVQGGMRVEFRFRDFANDDNSAWGSREGDATTTRARAYVRFDSRTQTEYGLLRTFVDLWFTQDSGNDSASVTLENGFIQFGGFTFGRIAHGFFDFYTGDAWGSILDQGFSDHETNVFAYTYGFGNGLSASVSVEDGTFSRGIIGNGTFDADGDANDVYGGHKMPDLIANLRVDQGWGSAQIMGAVHQVYGDSTVNDSEVGYAIGAGVTFNVPMIAPGDTVSFQAAYAKGAVAYVSSNLEYDAVIKNGNVDATTAWGIGGGFKHYWTPTITSGFSASYASLDGYGTTYDVDQLGVQGNLAWQPVSGFLMGVELEYLKNDYDRDTAGTTLVDDDDLVGMFRVQRTF
ncbi:porin-like protein [Breoghania corrubedonensis]|uniref:Porin n=1 Tax=Breoghania corrubedonensis TaxID=665038 RepID=A0A2T5VC58_9HYPH|nr:porin [Breoghania corrubedonensis]PTW61334.1 porin-like protein [Breoghania corrubedonensis]